MDTTTKTPADDVAGSDYFGTSVAIDGDTVIVGASKIVSEYPEEVHIFLQELAVHGPQQKIIPNRSNNI